MSILIEIDEIAGLPQIRQTHYRDDELFEIFNLDPKEADFLEVSISDDRALDDFKQVEVRDFIARLIAKAKLTTKERKILRLWMQGETYDSIAKHCGRNHRESVRFLLSNIIRKLRVAATELGEPVDLKAPIILSQKSG